MIRYVYYPIQGAELSYSEYFTDTDPGQGNAIPLTITGGVMNLSDLNLLVGSVIYIRVKDNYNRWSLPRGFERPAEIITPGSVLAGGEYFINTDPGKGNGIPLTFSGGTEQIDSLLFQYGDILYVRSKDNFDRWGPSRALKYQFKDMESASYKIKLASDSSTTLPFPMTLYPAPDSTCTWIAIKDSLTWHTNDTVWVRFQDEDGFFSSWKRGVIGNAGYDQTICTGNYATLSASGGSSYQWSNGMAGATIMVNPIVTEQYWVLISDGAGASSVDSVMVFVGPVPNNPGPITGLTDVCAGSTVTVYTVPIIQNATSYIWTLLEGATGSSTTNSIQVAFTSEASSGNIMVMGSNTCGQGTNSSLGIQVNTSIAGPSGAIIGPDGVCPGASDITYAIPVISNASSYNWTLPEGVTGSSITNEIVVDFGVSFVQGTISARGTNSCGDGIASILSIESVVMDTYTWTGNAGNAWNNPDNWGGCGVPDIAINVIIPNVSPNPFPVITDNVFCKTLRIETGAILTVYIFGSIIVGDEP
jgi:hypothetical protein